MKPSLKSLTVCVNQFVYRGCGCTNKTRRNYSRSPPCQTNLAYYPGDIFRTNFDYYARHTGKFELGEIEYFLGLQPSTTFSRNYCDYANDYAQFILFTKLERITKKLFNKDNFHARKEYKSFDDKYSIASTADPHDLSFMGIRLAVSDCSKLSIKVSSKHGYNIRIQEMEVSDDN